jgi:uncharacterized protein YdhG (YjbR/CyaY superfamily)
MKQTKKQVLTIDDYIQIQEKDKQAGLEKMRAIIKKAAPKAIECISYQMPAFKQNENLVYFALTKNHFGFYPTSKPIEAFKTQLDAKGYSYSKGAIQFPIDKPLPVKLIQDIIKFRLKEVALKQISKTKAKKDIIKK